MIYEKEKRYIIPFDDVPSSRVEMPEISIEERKGNFKEVELGFTEDMAIKEAKRCLSCRRCLGCALCWAECKPEAIDFSIPEEEVELEFDEIIVSDSQENIFYPIPSHLGYGKYPNVIPDIQFERMLSTNGPTGGIIMSPLNGDVPKMIAFVQSYPDGDDEHLLSSVIYGINEAIIALSKVNDMEATLISPLCDEFKEKYLDKASNITRLNIIDGITDAIEEDKEGLKVIYSRDGKQQESISVDLVVILTKPKKSAYIETISKWI